MQCKFVATEKAWFWGERTFCLEGNVNVHSGGFFAPLGRVEEPPIRNTSTFHQKYLYFLSEIPLLFIENTSTFSRKFLYFSQDVFLLRFGSHSTSSPKYLHFLSGMPLLPRVSCSTSCPM